MNKRDKIWKMIDESHLYSTPREAFLRLLGNTFIMMTTVYCYFNATTKVAIIGVATLTYVISYVGEIANWIDKNANILHKTYIICMVLWIVLVLAVSANAVFGDLQNGKNPSEVSLNDPLISLCFIPLIIQFVDLMFAIMVPDFHYEVGKQEKSAEYRLNS